MHMNAQVVEKHNLLDHQRLNCCTATAYDKMCGKKNLICDLCGEKICHTFHADTRGFIDRPYRRLGAKGSYLPL